MYREPGGKAPPEQPQTPRFFVVWPEKMKDERVSDRMRCIVCYKGFDTMEQAEAHVELRNKRDPEAQAYMFYGYMAIPQVKRETQVIEHVDTTYKVV